MQAHTNNTVIKLEIADKNTGPFEYGLFKALTDDDFATLPVRLANLGALILASSRANRSVFADLRSIAMDNAAHLLGLSPEIELFKASRTSEEPRVGSPTCPLIQNSQGGDNE